MGICSITPLRCNLPGSPVFYIYAKNMKFLDNCCINILKLPMINENIFRYCINGFMVSAVNIGNKSNFGIMVLLKHD
jgi:hypothetical protein